MGFLKHSENDKNSLYLTLTVWMMLAASTILMTSAVLMDTQSITNTILTFIRSVLEYTLRPIGLLVAVFAWGAIYWILDVYFAKIESYSKVGRLGKIFLVLTFIAFSVVAYLIVINLSTGYVWAFIVSAVLVISAFALFQLLMNRNP